MTIRVPFNRAPAVLTLRVSNLLGRPSELSFLEREAFNYSR